ncbi:MAG: site-specific DNA-methyltransferase [Deltaproteobacteria bacterium]|nr:site-specific DNA-methyltransferase [Deltaproteobacteria bacterium]
MNDEQRQEIIRRLQQGEEISPEWARILFPPEKREYELVYHGKEREEDIIANTLAVPLQKVRTFGKNDDSWHNMLIFGDNLQVMKSLLKMKEQGELVNADGTHGVRLVYIDPPFATKQEFRGSQDQKAYQDKIAGARFVEFIRRRLVMLKKLMSVNGNLVVHLDPRKMHYIKVICDEIFGEENFVNEVIWHKGREGGSSRSHALGSAMPTEYQNMIIYAKKRPERFWKPILGPYKLSTVKGVERDSRGWYYTRGRMGRQPAQWEIDAGEGKKTYVSNNPNEAKDEVLRRITSPDAEYVSRGDVWNSDIITQTKLTEYPTEKPEDLLDLVIGAGTGPGDLVLDAFAGSGTTCTVAEKLNRRWIGIDCGKLAIYTIQKRLLNLRSEVGNKGKPLNPKPFVLYNAGLYDFSKLKELSWDAWRFFALQLFQCRDETHKIGGIQLDGHLKGASVLVFNHQKQPGVRIDGETVQSMHEALGSKVGSRMFIIAPALVFDFQQDYLTLDGVRYYALRIPYSIIHELHQREFAALKQPVDEMAVNDTVDAVGFDFIRSPELDYVATANKRKDEKLSEGMIHIKTFKSEAVVRDSTKKANRETLSMVMLDYDFDTESDVFDLDAVFYAEAIQKIDWEVRFPLEPIGKQLMAVFVDIYGNEAREVIPASKFGLGSTKAAAKPAQKARKKAKK